MARRHPATMTCDELKASADRSMEFFDSLPLYIRVLVWEYGPSVVCYYYRILPLHEIPAAVRRHFIYNRARRYAHRDRGGPLNQAIFSEGHEPPVPTRKAAKLLNSL